MQIQLKHISYLKKEKKNVMMSKLYYSIKEVPPDSSLNSLIVFQKTFKTFLNRWPSPNSQSFSPLAEKLHFIWKCLLYAIQKSVHNSIQYILILKNSHYWNYQTGHITTDIFQVIAIKILATHTECYGFLLLKSWLYSINCPFIILGKHSINYFI